MTLSGDPIVWLIALGITAVMVVGHYGYEWYMKVKQSSGNRKVGSDD